jgi:ABC-type dipeptide/oligopeptide/nickel transport system permease subunit
MADPAQTVALGAPAAPGLVRRTRLSRWRRNSSTAAMVAAVTFLGGFCLAGLFAPLPFNPTSPDVTAIGLGPSLAHLFGTDATGFDVFSRVVDAAGRDVPVAVAGSLLALVLGVPVGLFATGGRLGEGLMRALDGFSALPIIVLVIVAIQLMGGSAFDVILAIAVVNIPRFARLTRAEAVALRSARFVEAAVAIGCSPLRIAFHHVFRNAYGVVLVQATLAAANAIGVIAALNFLGVGVRPPLPTWGGMIHDSAAMFIDGKWWAAAFPVVAIFLVVSAFNVIADWVESRVEGTGR